MSAQPEHPCQPSRIPCTQDAVAAALPPVQRMDFYREMGQAGADEIGDILKNWWLLVQIAGDPRTSRTAAAVKAGTATGRPASAIMRELRKRSQ
ncbi:hypothetical protein GCM10020367_17460 [Streptomyces sannanensis]|uniref:Uncharacterized protein n=1 Tax=Streptomyces sannanensis TaxID=285536 RepID=A0ABP6S8A3_9ACTN